MVPAWCDRKKRSFVWDAGSIEVGVFTVASGSIAFATEQGLVFAAKLTDVTLRWPGRLRWIRGCDMTIHGKTYRMYFVRPLPGAPRVRQSALTKITDSLTSPASDVVSLIGGTLGTVASIGAGVGHLLSVPGEFADEARGRRHGDNVRARIGG